MFIQISHRECRRAGQVAHQGWIVKICEEDAAHFRDNPTLLAINLLRRKHFCKEEPAGIAGLPFHSAKTFYSYTARQGNP
jgi:hypothetical protein